MAFSYGYGYGGGGYDSSANLLTPFERSLAPKYDAGNYIKNPDSWRYHDVVTHIPLQRQAHQYNSYAYKTNQMIKHAYEDGRFGYTMKDMNNHADHMKTLSDKEAYQYAQGLGWEKNKKKW